MIIILSKKWTCATWWSLSFLDIFIRACTWLPPPFPLLKPATVLAGKWYTAFNECIPHPVYYLKQPCQACSLSFLHGMKLGKYQLQTLLFFPLCYNSTFLVWLSLDLGPCLRRRAHARHWKTIHVWSWFWSCPTHRRSIHQADSVWVEEELAVVQLVCLATLQEKKQDAVSFGVTDSGSVRSRTICVIRWRAFYKSSPELWIEQCLTLLPPADPGI